MDKLNNSEDVKRFLQGLGIQIDETVVHQVVNTLSGKSKESFYSIYATRPNKLPPICGKGTAYKIKKLYDKGELDLYLAYLALLPTSNRENEKIEGNLISPTTEKLSEKSVVEQPTSPQVDEAETKALESQRKEAPWHLGGWEDNERSLFSAEAIAAIHEVQFWLERVKDKPNTSTAGIKEWTEHFTNGKMTTTIWPLTTREACWIAKLYKMNYILLEPERLYFLIHERGKQPPKNPTRQKLDELFTQEGVPLRRAIIENPSKLWETAKTYADYERLCELAGIIFDTSRLDEALRTGSIGKTKYDLFSEYMSKSENSRDRTDSADAES